MAGGRPSEILKVVGYREVDGVQTPIKVGERVAELMAQGNYLEMSARSAGISAKTAYNWLKAGARIEIANAGDADTNPALTETERGYVQFLRAVLEAESRYEVGANLDLQRLARGGLTVTTTTEKQELVDGEWKTTGRTVRTEELPPDGSVIQWRLTRRFRDRYAAVGDLSDLDGPMALSIEERAESLLEKAKTHREAARPRRASKATKKGAHHAQASS